MAEARTSRRNSAGAKNACLTLMPATLLTDEPLTLTNAPRLSDIRTMTALLGSLGAEVAAGRPGRLDRLFGAQPLGAGLGCLQPAGHNQRRADDDELDDRQGRGAGQQHPHRSGTS